jgi:putative hydrolase of the HAD superfamily
MLKYAIFDLDETLYPTTNGLMQTISNRMREYIVRKYGLSPEEAHALQKHYWNEYGTTLRGLYLERKIDPAEYLRFVHDVPVREFVAPDPKLREVLERIPQDKVILTNADAPHARRILDTLGLADQFTRIFDVVCFDYECKPAPVVYERLLQMLPARGEVCVLVDDQARNLVPARALGLKTILLGNNGEADAHIATIYEVADAIAALDTHG